MLYFAFEEAPRQIIRNMRSVGIDLESFIEKGSLRIQAARPTVWGLEMHLAAMHKAIVSFQPYAVILDPVSNLVSVGEETEVRSMLTRLMDFMKSKQITGLFTDLASGGNFEEATGVGISSLMDTWIFLRSVEINGERNRTIYVLKARGIAHSNQMREFLLTSGGIDITDVYTGPAGVLTGTARVAQEARERADKMVRDQDMERKQRTITRKEEIMENRIRALRAQFEEEKSEIEKEIQEQQLLERILEQDRRAMAEMRQPDSKK